MQSLPPILSHPALFRRIGSNNRGTLYFGTADNQTVTRARKTQGDSKKVSPLTSRGFIFSLAALIPLLLTALTHSVIQKGFSKANHERYEIERQAKLHFLRKISPDALPPHVLRWPTNTTVYASALQSDKDYADLKEGYSFYTKQLMAHLNQPDIPSLDEAHQKLETGVQHPKLWIDRDGDLHPQIAISSLDRSHGEAASLGWQKGVHKPRFVLIIQGGEYPPESHFKQDAQTAKSGLQSQFDIPDKNIRTLSHPTLQQVEQEMQWLKSMQERTATAEVLVYLVGYGTGFPIQLPRALQNLQGAHNATFELDPLGLNEGNPFLDESNLKKWFLQYLSGFSHAVLVVNTSDSAAWIR